MHLYKVLCIYVYVYICIYYTIYIGGLIGYIYPKKLQLMDSLSLFFLLIYGYGRTEDFFLRRDILR